VSGFFYAQKWANRMEKEMSVTHVERISMSTPHQFAATLPALVGFKPKESVVIAMLRESQVIVTMRCDLPDDWATATEEITGTILRLGADEVLIAVVTDHRVSEMPNEAEIGDLIAELSVRDIPVKTAILVDEGRFWDYLCTSDECCSIDGNVIDPNVSSMKALEVISREDVAARYALREDMQPPAEAMDQVIQELGGDPLQRAERSWNAVRQLATEPELSGLGTAGDVLRAYVQLAFLDVRVRDYVLGQVASLNDPEPFVDVLTDTALRSAAEVRSRMCGTAAAVLAATQCSTVPASCLAELAGNDSLANLVKEGIRGGFPPASLNEIFRDALPVVIRQLATEDTE
jgi:CBS domain-containing protein